jgi:hypothetical protein
MIHPFDLQARAELAAHSLTALLDPQRDGLMYFLATWRTRPPRADHCLWDFGDGAGRQIDALTLVRSIVRPESAQASPSAGELQLEAWMLRLLGADGLTWLPDDPFARPWGVDMLLREFDPEDVYAEISWAQRGTLLGLTSRFLATGDERFAEAGRHMVDGLLAVTIKTDDGMFFPEGYYRGKGWRFRQAGLYPGIEEYNAAIIVSAIRFFRATGYAPALQLCEGLLSFALKHSIGYLPDGRQYPGAGALKGQGTLDHFHTRSNFLLGVLEFGLLTGRRELVSWARQSYEFAKEWGTDFGWFPEGMGHRHGETCCTTDMIEAAILLGRHVDPCYYADAERFGRNHLLETQFLSLEMLERAAAQMPEDAQPPPHEGRYSTFENVAASQIGAFAARSTLNDAFHTDAPAMMQCCNAAGARAIHDLWRYAVDRSTMHMRFSVQNRDVRIVSHEPREGRLDITARADGPWSVRMPQGVHHAVAVVDGAAQSVAVEAGYARLTLVADKLLSLHYELPARSAAYTVGTPGRTASCTGHWRGETLVSVEPQGAFYPLYRRALDVEPVLPTLPAAAPLTTLFF